MSDLFNEKEITLDKLRENFHENDFSTLPVKDPSEYSEDELELYNRVLKHINTEWQEISKTLGLTHPQDCYSKDFPPELIKDRMQRIIADQVVKISNNEKVLSNILENIVFPELMVEFEGDDLLFCEEIADEALHNTVNALIQTLDIESIVQTVKAMSCDEDFNPNKALNYPKMDHDKKWNHSRAKIKIESLDEMAELSPTGEPPQIPDKANVETVADVHILIENLLDSVTEQEREIIGLLSEGYTQSEIAKKLGVSQSTISRKMSKFRKILSAGA